MDLDTFEKVYALRYVGGRVFIPIPLIGKITQRNMSVAELIVSAIGNVPEPFEAEKDYMLQLPTLLRLQMGKEATHLRLSGVPCSSLVPPFDRAVLADVGYVEPNEFIVTELEFVTS